VLLITLSTACSSVEEDTVWWLQRCWICFFC